MDELAKKLLELQTEYQNVETHLGAASEFGRPDWMPRTRDEIAADYSVALAQFLTHAGGASR